MNGNTSTAPPHGETHTQTHTETHAPCTALQDLLLTTEDVEEFLEHLVGIAVATIGGGISAGVTVARDGRQQ